MSSIFCSVATQHDTCPVCRKSLNGEDSSSSQAPSESPSLSTDPRTQERWSFWDTHLVSFLGFSSPTSSNTQEDENASHFPLFISLGVVIISVWFLIFFFFFFCFNAFLFNHVYRYPNSRLNGHLRWLDLYFLFCLVTYQLRLMMIKSMSSLRLSITDSIFLEMHCWDTLLWENARLYTIMHRALLELAKSCNWALYGIYEYGSLQYWHWRGSPLKLPLQ